MRRDRFNLPSRQAPADCEHDVAGIAPPLAPLPFPQLLGQISRRLPGERRVARSDAFPPNPVAGGARQEAAIGIAADVEHRRGRACGRSRFVGHAGVVGGNRLPIAPAQADRDRLHLGMLAATVGIVVELPVEVADVESGEPRDARAVAAAVQSVTGEAGVRRARVAAAERDELTAGGEAIRGRRLTAASRARQQQGCDQARGAPASHALGNRRSAPMVPE